jgi:pimeloyl-ACP methyl ester carboxylesterase
MPNAYCFDDAIQSEIWSTGRRAVGGLNDSVYALQYGWASHEARGQLCAHTDNGKFDQEANLRQHVSTAYVARDMLAIADKVEQHKLANEQILLAQPHGQQRIREQRGHSSVKLQYIGTSYGTFLGQTFAAMYPEHVGRFVLDGNVDGDNWVSKHELGIEDNAEARNYFFARCFAAAVRCAFFRSSDQSPSDVEHRFESLLSTLDEAPYPMAGFGYASPITKSDVLSGFMTTAYQPLLFFSLFAEFLDDLYTDQPLRDGPFWLRPVPTREVFADDLLINRYQGGETGPAVHCSDGPDLSSVGLPEFQRYMENLTATYGWAGAIQAEFKLPCWTWPSTMRTKWRYAGPFSYPRNSTSRGAPILFVNNRVDPVCSVKNAERAARKYRGSVVLIQDAVGHGALWPAGKCVWDHVKSYFDDGVLPENGTVCPAPCEAFGTTCDGVDLTAFDKGGRWWWH